VGSGALRRAVCLSMLVPVLLAFTSCASPGGDSPEGGSLEGVQWRLTESSISSTDLGAAGITATFSKGTVSGFSGVNTYSGSCTAKADGAFQTGPLASTEMAGPEALMRAESAYLVLLASARRYRRGGTILTLFGAGDNELLIFESGGKSGSS